jgi:threonine/homoserine/homoserine lactone efflux protein
MSAFTDVLTWKFLISAVIIILLPGPSVMFTIGRALAYGPRTAVLTVVGNTAGAMVIGIAVVSGLGLLLQGQDVALAILQVGGALYLVYLGVQAWRHRGESSGVTASGSVLPVGRILREGFVVGITNPKTIVFFTAVIPQFVNPDAGPVALQLLVLILTFEAIALVSDSAWGILAATVMRSWAQTPGRVAGLVGFGGLMIIGLGVWLLSSSISTLVPSAVGGAQATFATLGRI